MIYFKRYACTQMLTYLTPPLILTFFSFPFPFSDFLTFVSLDSFSPYFLIFSSLIPFFSPFSHFPLSFHSHPFPSFALYISHSLIFLPSSFSLPPFLLLFLPSSFLLLSPIHSRSPSPSVSQDDGVLEEGEGAGAINLSARPSRQPSPLDTEQVKRRKVNKGE